MQLNCFLHCQLVGVGERCDYDWYVQVVTAYFTVYTVFHITMDRVCNACGEKLTESERHCCNTCKVPLHARLVCPNQEGIHISISGVYFCASHQKDDPLFGQSAERQDIVCSECNFGINGSTITCKVCATPMHSAAQCNRVKTFCYNIEEETYTCRSCQGGKCDTTVSTKTTIPDEKKEEEDKTLEEEHGARKRERPDFFSDEGIQQMRVDRERIKKTEKYSLDASLLRQAAVDQMERDSDTFAQYCSGDEQLVNMARTVLALDDDSVMDAVFANRMHELRGNKEYGDYLTALVMSRLFSMNINFWIVDVDTKRAVPHPSLGSMTVSEPKLCGAILQNREQTHFLTCFPEDEATRLGLGGVRLQTNDGRWLVVIDVPMDGACQFSSFAVIFEQQGVTVADEIKHNHTLLFQNPNDCKAEEKNVEENSVTAELGVQDTTWAGLHQASEGDLQFLAKRREEGKSTLTLMRSEVFDIVVVGMKVKTWSSVYFRRSGFACDAGGLYYVPSIQKRGILQCIYSHKKLTNSNYYAILVFEDGTHACILVREVVRDSGREFMGLESVLPFTLCSPEFWESMSTNPVEEWLVEFHADLLNTDIDTDVAKVGDKRKAGSIETPLRRSRRSKSTKAASSDYPATKRLKVEPLPDMEAEELESGSDSVTESDIEEIQPKRVSARGGSSGKSKDEKSKCQQCQRLNAQILSLKSKHNTKVDKHKTQVSKLQSNVSSANAEAKEMKQEIVRLKSRVTALTSKIVNLESRLERKEEAYTRLSDSFVDHTKMNHGISMADQLVHFKTLADITASLRPELPNAIDIIKAMQSSK